MAGNVIYRGPVDKQPRTIQKEVVGAYLPGTFVEETATTLAQITSALAKLPLLLSMARKSVHSDYVFDVAARSTG